MQSYRFFILASFLAFFAQKVAAQSLFPFTTDSTTWTRKYVSGALGPNDVFSVSETIMLGDTLLDGKTYSKLTDRGRCSCFCTGQNLDPGWIGYPDVPFAPNYFLRVDGPKIYLRDFNGVEAIRYDFSLMLGDSIWLEGLHYVVNYVSFDNVGRKRLRVQTGTSSLTRYEDWVEGIGNIGGPLAFPTGCIGLGPCLDGGCISTQLPSTCLLPCSPTVNTSETTLSEPKTLTPNPVSTFFQLDFGSLEPFSVAVFSADGRLFFEQKNVRKSEAIDASRLPSGLFIAVARAENLGIKSVRFLKL